MQPQRYISYEARRGLMLCAWVMASIATLWPSFSGVIFFPFFPLGLFEILERLNGPSTSHPQSVKAENVFSALVGTLMAGWLPYAVLTAATLMAERRSRFIIL